MTLADWQIISIAFGILVAIIGSAVGATKWTTWRLSKALTKIEGIEGRLNRIEDDIRTVFNRFHEISRAEVGELRQDLREERRKSEAKAKEEKKD
jgi:hypothetical protein